LLTLPIQPDQYPASEIPDGFRSVIIHRLGIECFGIGVQAEMQFALPEARDYHEYTECN